MVLNVKKVAWNEEYLHSQATEDGWLYNQFPVHKSHICFKFHMKNTFLYLYIFLCQLLHILFKGKDAIWAHWQVFLRLNYFSFTTMWCMYDREMLTGIRVLENKCHFVLSTFSTSLRLCREVWRTLKTDGCLGVAWDEKKQVHTYILKDLVHTLVFLPIYP